MSSKLNIIHLVLIGVLAVTMIGLRTAGADAGPSAVAFNLP